MRHFKRRCSTEFVTLVTLRWSGQCRFSRELLKGGVGILQLRAKGQDPEGLVSLARELKILCDEFGVPFVVNDHLDVAKASAAHGLHLGQDDGSILSAREELKAGVMIWSFDTFP